MYKVIKKNLHPMLLTALGVLILSASPYILSATSSSTSINKEAAIKVRADYMVFDLKTGRNIYEGNVSIVQGSIRLSGDKVTVLRTSNKISNIEITGNPARYLQDENTDNIVHAMSQRMQYSAQQNRLVLLDNASLEQSDHIVESQRIIYDTDKKMIIAGKDSTTTNDSRQRVNITLMPKKDRQKKQPEK